MLLIRMAKRTLQQVFGLGCQELYDQCGVFRGEIPDTLPFCNALLFKITPCHQSVSSHPKVFAKTNDSSRFDLLSFEVCARSCAKRLTHLPD